MGDAGESPAIAAAVAERTLRRLRADLARWFGSEGFHALLLRALDRARPDHPALARVSPRFNGGDVGPNGLDGLFDNLQPCSAAETSDALAAVVAEVIALLGRFLGDDAAIRLVRQGWSETSGRGQRSTEEETRE